MAHTSPAQSSPAEVPKRPRGILKNSSSYQNTSPEARISPTTERPSLSAAERPEMPHRELSEKEITQMNTNINAGNGHRRNSSNPRGSMSRRQSSAEGQTDENEPRLKWDEANLYLNEGEMGGKMKIDEPKTPYAKQYDPSEDEEEVSAINAQDLAVDELDMAKSKKTKEDEIPGLDIGGPEMEGMERHESDGERRVIVDSTMSDADDGRHDGETAGMSREEQEKHKKFEEMRKKHYEMKDVKGLLGHPEELDALDEDGDKPAY